MDSMCAELLDLILSKLFAKDRLAFSLVCRAWDKAVAASSYRHSPCLMLNNRKTTTWEVFQHNNYFSMDFPNLDKNAVIRCSNYGWLLMCTDDEILFFFDPFNNRRIEVPRLPNKNNYTTISFFHSPTSPNCFIIGIKGVHNCPVEIVVLKHGEDEWNTSSIEFEKMFGASLAPPILDGGKLYFLDYRGNVATFDMSRDRIAESGEVHSQCLKQRRLQRNIKEHYLIKIKDQDAIFGVFVMKDHGEVRVFKLLDDISWEPVEDLGDKVFYVSNTSSFGYITRDKNIANKIFFPKFDGNKVVFYSLETRKYHSFEGDYSSVYPYGLKRYELAAWMIPATTPQFPGEPLTWCVKDSATHQDSAI